MLVPVSQTGSLSKAWWRPEQGVRGSDGWLWDKRSKMTSRVWSLSGVVCKGHAPGRAGEGLRGAVF